MHPAITVFLVTYTVLILFEIIFRKVLTNRSTTFIPVWAVLCAVVSLFITDIELYIIALVILVVPTAVLFHILFPVEKIIWPKPKE